MFKYIAFLTVTIFAILLNPKFNFAQGKLNFNSNTKTNPRDFNFGNWFAGSKNFFEITYGLGNIKHKNISLDFHDLIIKEFKFGKRHSKPVANYMLTEVSEDYLFSSYIENSESINSQPSKIAYDIWRFGLGYKKGYGYNFDSFTILPFYQLGFAWSNPKFTHPHSNIVAYTGEPLLSEIYILNKYNNAIKFGTTNVAGFDLKISSLLNVGGSYETSVIFPYHLAWKQLGSFLIEIASQTGLDYLTKGVIIKSIPEITPVLYFLLKNGLSYFLFTKKQSDMNWPFDTASPITLESYKINLKITF